MRGQYDVIVVGAGNGGLAAAAAAAKNGLKTLLIEKHNIPGGCATSFRRGRFEFETSLHELCDYGPANNPGPVRKLFTMLGVEVDWCVLPDTFRSIVIGPNGYDVAMPTGRKEFADKMEEYVPGSRQSIEQIYSYADDLERTCAYLEECKGKPDPMVMLSEHANFMRLVPSTVNEVLNMIGMPKKAQYIFNTYWSYLGVDCDTLDFANYALMTVSYITRGAYIPKMRSHEISLALEKVVHEHGGDVWYNTEVTKILVKNGKAYGIAINDREIYCDHIICNVNPHIVYGKMMDKKEVPERAIKLANARKFSQSAYTVYIGLDKSPEELGIKDYTTFIYDTADTVTLDASSAVIDNQSLAVNCLNIAIPECSPPGTSMLFFTKLYSEDCWKDVKIEDYVKTKNRVAEHAIEHYEKYCGVKIRDSIEEISAATPFTFARYLGSPSGDIYGYKGSKWDGMFQRLAVQEEEHFTQGLRFCGASSAWMHGYSQAYISGGDAVMLTLRDIQAGY